MALRVSEHWYDSRTREFPSKRNPSKNADLKAHSAAWAFQSLFHAPLYGTKEVEQSRPCACYVDWHWFKTQALLCSKCIPEFYQPKSAHLCIMENTHCSQLTCSQQAAQRKCLDACVRLQDASIQDQPDTLEQNKGLEKEWHNWVVSMRGSSKICFKGLKEENTVSCSTVPRVDDLFIDPACCFAALMSSKLHRIIVLSTVPAFATGIEGFLMDFVLSRKIGTYGCE